MRRERIASVVTALALVLAAVGGGAVAPASAQSGDSYGSEICTLGDLVGANGLDVAYDCLRNDKDTTDYENLSATDAYTNALALKDDANSYTTTFSNFQENSRTVAYQKGKIAVVRALENESGPAVMKNEANQSVRDYYSRQQLELINHWNNNVRQVMYLRNTSANIVPEDDSGTVGEFNGGYDLVNSSTSLVNGTTTTMLALEIRIDGQLYIFTPFDEVGVTNPYAADPQRNVLAIEDPATGDTTPFLNQTDYYHPLQEIQSQSQQVTANMDAYAEGVSNQYNAGEINATTLYQNDPSLLFSEASTDFNSTGYYGYASVQLAAIGAGGDLNQSHVITINGGEYVGTLFYTGEDADKFETNKTYNFADYNGTFMLAASDTPNNETGIVTLNERGSSFTIESATNTRTGEEVQNTSINKYVYKSADANNLQQEIERLSELREFYEQQASAGGGVGINLGTDDKAIIGGILAVILVLALRD